MIDIPKQCPCCSSELERVKDQLFCRNTQCGDVAQKKVLKYCQKRKIKGLAEKSIQKMNINSVADIYKQTEEELIEVLGKNGTKIYQEIQKSLNTTLAELIGSLSIPLVGRTTAEKITGSLAQAEYNALPNKAKANFMVWWNSSERVELADIAFVIAKVKQKGEDVLEQGTLCITGSFKGYNRVSIKELAESKGYRVVTSVTKNTKLLLADKPSSTSKYTKAEELGIKIIFNIEEL